MLPVNNLCDFAWIIQGTETFLYVLLIYIVLNLCQLQSQFVWIKT